MPRFDGTGPQGKGPMTGRKMGPCKSGQKTYGPGQRNVRGLGRFYGWRKNWSKEELGKYKQALLEELSDLDKELGQKAE
jgi:hypothetical protein